MVAIVLKIGKVCTCVGDGREKNKIVAEEASDGGLSPSTHDDRGGSGNIWAYIL